MFKKIIEFIFFGSIIIGLCVVAMCIETNLLLHLPLNTPGFYFFVFGASLVQYNFHYLLKKTALPGSAYFNWSQKNSATHIMLILCGILVTIASLFLFKLTHFTSLLLMGIITLLYSLPVLPFAAKKRIKDFGVIKIITLALLWTLVTVWLPANQAIKTNTSFLIIFLQRFFYIFVLCLAFDIRDIDIDSKENIQTIPVLAGKKGTYVICYSLLFICILLSFIQYLITPEISHLIPMLLSFAATFIMIEYTKKNISDIRFLTYLDGMMLLQPILVIIGSI